MATYPSPEAARAANSGGGDQNAASQVKTTGPSARKVYRQSRTGVGYVRQVFEITGATDV
jgi:hypothetical protein